MPKIYHMAAKMNDAGDVSALCFKRPRKIDLRRSTWTIRPVAVTCPRCRKLLPALALRSAVLRMEVELTECAALEGNGDVVV